MSNPNHENREYIIASDTAYPLGEIAELLSTRKGITLPYNPAGIELYISTL